MHEMEIKNATCQFRLTGDHFESVFFYKNPFIVDEHLSLQ
ncbi:hypothetical protein B4113_2292 [Geobacillus sp. B4113_201601]|nr:hypothetical protein B4113_2292 [Geobacillus sp. B4113_201601]